MKRKWVIGLAAVGAVVAIAGGAWLALRDDPDLGQRVLAEIGLGEPDEAVLRASGFVEAEEVAIAAEIGGRVAELRVGEGDLVAAGETLLQLDTTLIDGQIALAQARLAAAEAEVAEAEAGPRPEQVRQAEAAVRLARRGRDGAYRAWQDVRAIQDNPQELNAQIAQARSEVEAARAAVARAEAMKDAAEIGYEAFHEAREAIQEARERWEEIPEPQRPPEPELGVQLDFHLIPNEYWKAWIALEAAQARLDGARTALNDLLRMRDNPQELAAEVDAARTEYEAAERRVEKAEAQLEGLRAGATAEQVGLLEARVKEAEAELETLLREREKLTLAAPRDGVVLRLRRREGELTAPGTTILTLGDLDEVTLMVFVPVTRLADVEIGQAVAVRADSMPGRPFEGEVVAIAEQAEFAPREIEIRQERMNLVFAVEVRIPNPDHALKPGSYAEGHFGPEAPGTVAQAAGDGGVRAEEESAVYRASGFIEGVRVTVASEAGGRVAELLVERGDAVTVGQTLLRLDDGALQSERREAEARLSTAEANLALVRAGARSEEVAAAEAELAEAEVVFSGTLEALVHAREAITNPQALDARINEVRTQAALAEQEVEMARAELAAVKLKRQVYAEQGGDVERVWDLRVEGAEAAVEEAEARLRGTRAQLGVWVATRAEPLNLQAALDRAEAEAQMAEIQVDMQQARVEELRAGPTAEEVAVAQRRVEMAGAAVGLVEARISQLTLEAPLSGVVSARMAQRGETALAGRPLLTIANLDEVTLTVYVPQRHIGRVRIGQAARVTANAFPREVFSGRVSRIAGEAEFTPSDVLTEEERVSLVFAVEVTIPNPEHALRPGMPAEAAVELDGGTE